MDITRESVIEILESIFPFLKEDIENAAGVYEALGIVAIFLGERIEKGEIDETLFKETIHLIDDLAAHNDREIRNMLVVGIFETLANYEKSMTCLKRKMGAEANELFDKYLF